MPEHQEGFNTPLSSADGRPPMASCFYNTAHVTFRGERARAAASLARSGRRSMLSAAFICIVLSASAGSLPGSRRRKDNNALSSPYFQLSLLFRHRRGLSGCLRNGPVLQPASHNNGDNHFFICGFLMCHPDPLFFCFVQMVRIQMVLDILAQSVSGVETEALFLVTQ